MTTRTPRLNGWQRDQIKRRLFMQSPLCASCGERAAEELDHVVPLHRGGSNDASNLQGLCPECHRRKTATDTGRIYRPRIGRDGWPTTD